MAKTDPSSSRFYITTPIYYVNARPHLGHAYSTIVCDAIARRKRAMGIDTWFLTGTDEHGQKIERSAKLAGCTPQDFADKIASEFRAQWDRLGLTYDDFIRTTEPRHKRGVQKLFATLRDRGFIYKGSYTGQYCVSDEAWVDVPPGAPCPDCGRITETVSEENYFFKLSAFERKLLEFYDENPGFMQPESTRREVISFVRSGLKDLSISRSSFTWGIPVPGDEKHVVYVWLDALANYITALGYGSDDPADQARFAKFWPADIHLIGKEISRFHCVYWPAFLMAAGLPTPRSVKANGWLLFDQGKMSKSRGNIVRADTVREVLGADALRYFLLREIPFGQDGSFTFDALVQRYNGDLANGYGNLVSRVVNMVHKYFGGVVPETGAETQAESSLRESTIRTTAAFAPLFEGLDFSEALKTLWALVAETDGYLTANAPWKRPADRSEGDHAALQARVLATAAEAIRVITALVYPILPDAASKVWQQLGQGEIADAAKQAFLTNLAWGGLKAGTHFGEPAPLFPRAEKDAVTRMQNLEDENNKNAIEAASNQESAEKTAPEAPTSALGVNPHPGQQPPADSVKSAPSATSVQSPSSTEDGPAGTAATTAPSNPEKPVATAHVHTVPAELSSSRLSSTPAEAPANQPLHSKETQDPSGAPTQPAQTNPTVISIDDFAKVELRVAQILVAERIPKADKLLRLEVDLGYEKRQILAGIAQYYEPEKLIGRKIVIVANLAPRKMRGLESNGMLLAASLPTDGAPVLAGFLEDVPLGARLK
ncbi:methionine--tRNA ligase [Telmatobacter sp. DSM 110680]|uniref:Methionine--tRNA ligase n=1 Tax=Telmatobacter sp. DSM 110680 TaxID=3036704 RepID=A0AAU7DJB6_9BACT